MSRLLQHAETELSLIGMGNESEDMNKMMHDHIITMVKAFADEGHSGLSVGYAIGILEKLLRLKPLTPLTGDDDEWMPADDGVFQNKRCTHVFKENGEAYDINGKVFIDSDGCSYTSRDSKVSVTFPYTPKTEYINV